MSENGTSTTEKSETRAATSRKADRRAYPSIAEGIATIEAKLAAHPEAPMPPLKGLPLSALIVCETVFQRRDLWSNKLVRDEHVRDLKRAIKEDPSGMEPVIVWWGGDGWYLIDGHHRVLAYESLEFKGGIPVRVVSGTIKDALGHVGLANTRNKLPMTNAERMSLAVFYVCMTPEKSLREIARMTGVGKSQVGNIRNAITRLVSEGENLEHLAEETWQGVQRRSWQFEPGENDYVMEQRMKANEIKEALKPVLGKKPHFQAEAVMMALKEISPNLWRSISDQIIHEHDIQEEQDELDANCEY